MEALSVLEVISSAQRLVTKYCKIPFILFVITSSVRIVMHNVGLSYSCVWNCTDVYLINHVKKKFQFFSFYFQDLPWSMCVFFPQFSKIHSRELMISLLCDNRRHSDNKIEKNEKNWKKLGGWKKMFEKKEEQRNICSFLSNDGIVYTKVFGILT